MKKFKFWEIDPKGKFKIIETKLLFFLTASGFRNANLSSTNYILVKQNGNVVEEVSDKSVVTFVKNYLIKIKNYDVLESFVKGSSSYVSRQKMRMLDEVHIINDRDDSSSSWFHFENLSWRVDSTGFTSILKSDIKFKIWKSRIIPNSCCSMFNTKYNESQFGQFCFNLAGKSSNRFKALKSIIGYLLHRHNNPSNTRAIILIDENMSKDDTAYGGTGKSLLMAGIEKCREIVVMDGKNMKIGSSFKNQRISRTTDIVFYDDVTKQFSLEALYSMITTGIVVERKYKDEEYIKPENAPKICISSNYTVKGTGGSTDIRRRCDFEVSNHYSTSYTPYDEFGNYFFSGWDLNEWNSFHVFMMSCTQDYLKTGLIIPDPINLKTNTLLNDTSEEFVSFVEQDWLKTNQWYGKKQTHEKFIKLNQHLAYLSLHKLTRWFKRYAEINGYYYEDRKSGKKFEFYLREITENGYEEE